MLRRPISRRIAWTTKPPRTSMATRRALSGVMSGFDSTRLLKTSTRPSTSQILSSSSQPPTNFSTSSPAPPTAHDTQDPTIYILGLGNLGKFFAHSLATLPPPPPITILTHRPALPPAFAASGASGSVITLTTPSGVSTPAHGITLSSLSPTGPPITHLIIATKSPPTAPALSLLAPRLSRTSTLLFPQNGLGALAECTTAVFPDPASRPTYLAAVVTHGLFSTTPFAATLAGPADMQVGFVEAPRPGADRYLLDRILAAPQLAARELEPRELAGAQLEKLVANAVINPLTALLRVPNGGLLIPAVEPLRRALLREASAVILAHLSGGGALDEETAARFGEAALEASVRRVTERTKGNRSSMLQDVEAGRGTEVRYVNGWIAGRGGELGVDVRTHRQVVRLVEGGRAVGVGELGGLFPGGYGMADGMVT